MPRACPLCGSEDSSRVVVESNYRGQELGEFGFSSRKTPDLLHLQMVRCPTCDLVYVPMAPDPDWLHSRYREAAYDAAEESQLAAETRRGAHSAW